MRKPITVFVPTNRAYSSKRNWGKPAPMDGLNEIIAQNRANKDYGAAMERDNVQHCARFVRAAMRVAGYAPMTAKDRCKCHVRVKVYEPHDQRDVPNVYGGVLKYAIDALTARNKNGVGAIWDDNSKWMSLSVLPIAIDPINPGIEITVIPLEVKSEA